MLWALAHGSFWYHDFLRWASHPVVVALNVITWLFVVLHAVLHVVPGWSVDRSALRLAPGLTTAEGRVRSCLPQARHNPEQVDPEEK